MTLAVVQVYDREPRYTVEACQFGDSARLTSHVCVAAAYFIAQHHRNGLKPHNNKRAASDSLSWGGMCLQ